MGFPLELFRQEMGIHPYHFWQLANDTVPVKSACNAVIHKYAWQDTDKISRQDIAGALEKAINKLAEYLTYSPIQNYSSQTFRWPRYNDPGVLRAPFIGPRGEWLAMKLREGYIQQLGIEALTLISDVAAVVYTDTNSDGIADKFTITLATSVTDPGQIALYFSAIDRLSGNMADWRIEPIAVSIVGGNAIITGPAWIMVHPLLYDGVSSSTLDPAASGVLVSTAAVYQRSTYTAGTGFDDCQARIEYETHPYPWWGWFWPNNPTGGSDDVAVVGYAVGRGGIRDSKLGYVMPVKEAYDPSSGVWTSDIFWSYQWEPDRVTVRYLAGYPLTAKYQIDPKMVTLVSRMACAELGRPIVACEDANREVYRWQFDVARSSGANDEAYAISPEDLTNPFGTRRGHIWAWRTVKRLTQLSAVIS